MLFGDASLDAVIRELGRQAVRWRIAALQDAEPAVAVLHANYAVAYALALRQVAEDDEIQRVTGKTGKKLQDEAAMAQDRAAKMLAARCPSVVPPGAR